MAVEDLHLFSALWNNHDGSGRTGMATTSSGRFLVISRMRRTDRPGRGHGCDQVLLQQLPRPARQAAETESAGTFATTGAPIIALRLLQHQRGHLRPARPSARIGSFAGPGSGAGDGGKTFTAIFNAVAPSTYNRSEATSPTKVAYGAGISDWCATCHPDMHSGTSAKLTHPVNQGISAAVATNYNSYLGSGRTGTSGYDSLVPFQRDNSSDYVALRAFSNDNTATQVSTSDRVMCLSCHRAHASGFEFMGRWNNAGEFIAVDGCVARDRLAEFDREPAPSTRRAARWRRRRLRTTGRQ